MHGGLHEYKHVHVKSGQGIRHARLHDEEEVGFLDSWILSIKNANRNMDSISRNS